MQSAGRRRQNPCRNLDGAPGLQLRSCLPKPKTDLARRGLRRAGPRLPAPGLFAATRPGSADSAPVRVVVLGQTATTPPPSCPGKIVNGVEVIPCRVEGHVTGFQAIAGGVAQPYEAPFDGKIVAWSITLARPSRKETKTTTDEVGFFNEFLGNPSEARIGVLRPVEGSKPPKYTLVRQSPLEILNPYFGSKVVFALEHPLTVLQGQVVALTCRPGRRCSPSTSPAKTPGAAAASPNTAPPGRHPGRPPPAGRRQDEDLRLLLLQRPPALHGDARQEALAPVRGPTGAARSRGSR